MMTQFFKKISLFTVIPLIVGLLIFIPLANHITGSHSDVQIKSNITNIFVGDSHIESAINDSIIPQSLNLATSAESFYFSYFKLKMLLEKCPSINHVYLGVSYHSLSTYYDRFISGDFSVTTSPKYFYLLTPKEQIRIIYWNKANPVSLMKSIINQGIAQLLHGQYSFMGGFSNYFKETAAVNSSMDKRLLFQYYNNGNLNTFSEFNIHYLNEIIGLCKIRGVEFTILNTPLHEYYYKKVPKEYKDKLNEIVTTNKLNYIDLTNLILSDKCFIQDGDHVSYLGAEKTSIELRKIMHERTTHGIVRASPQSHLFPILPLTQR
jgi:hypothetical protein